ncbi:MAG: bifunctional phosphoribosylaminoimidazolecarboxamide formyltransferase/IMP cyclohydrolase [bacterium]|nr:bifunctional phosphoribosylaminoimidazolecarboxamide formyltransferase/IMP cyclohydrolase [bacterium]
MKALISVSDKEGVINFARSLAKHGYEIISTGGTYKVLHDAGLDVLSVEEITHFPEMLSGRVKTLHPKVHGGILAVKDNQDHIDTCEKYNIPLIDLVVVNLYPFKKTIDKPDVTMEEAIENIDIGGPAMIRSAAKNYKSVGVIVDPSRYESIIEELSLNKGQLSMETRISLACDAFHHTAKYDSTISCYLDKQINNSNPEKFPLSLSPVLHKVSDLRYGENPHQKAALYKIDNTNGLLDMEQLHGKELSYNNIIDLEAAWNIAQEFVIPGAVLVKHTNPCGAAIDDNLEQAYRKACEGDPISAFGSIVGLNRVVDKNTAVAISETFVEAVIAPDFDNSALEVLKKKVSIRLIKLKNFKDNLSDYMYRYVPGGFLLQTNNNAVIEREDLITSTKKKPVPREINDLLFAFSVVKHVKSNAILIVKNGQVLGVGAGQMSRVQAVKIAVEKAGEKCSGAVLASDAFFPFKDSIELAADSKISAVIQPGGSKRDQESIDCCNARGISMVYTGIRNFKH